jgi:hypothetical protein
MTVEEKAEEYGQIVAEGTGIIDFKHVSVNAYMDGYNEAIRWRDPKEELPKEGVNVFVKMIRSGEYGEETIYTSSHVVNDFYHDSESNPFGCEGYYPAGNGGRVRVTVIGWRPIE